MIWFGNRVLPGTHGGLSRLSEIERMEHGIRWVAERAPALEGGDLVQALASTGWVEEATARRLLPLFRGFDADGHFAERLRSLSFRGLPVQEDFRSRLGQVLVDLTGDRASVEEIAGSEALRFRIGEREGLLFAFPEVGCSAARRLRGELERIRDIFPNTVMVVARSFARGSSGDVRAELGEPEVASLLTPVNRLLGLRAVVLRYRPDPERVMDLLCSGSIESRDVARLAEARV